MKKNTRYMYTYEIYYQQISSSNSISFRSNKKIQILGK